MGSVVAGVWHSAERAKAGEIGEAMVELDRGSFEGMVALVDEDSLKVA